MIMFPHPTDPDLRRQYVTDRMPAPTTPLPHIPRRRLRLRDRLFGPKR
jgi:hypothetical protein